MLSPGYGNTRAPSTPSDGSPNNSTDNSSKDDAKTGSDLTLHETDTNTDGTINVAAATVPVLEAPSEHAPASETTNVSVSESTHEPTSTTTPSNADSRVQDPDYVPDDDADDVETVESDFL